MIELVHTEIENLRRVRNCRNIVKLIAVYECKKEIKIVTSFAGDCNLQNYIHA